MLVMERLILAYEIGASLRESRSGVKMGKKLTFRRHLSRPRLA